MDTTLSQPYAWLKKLPSSVLQLNESPLWGYSPPFPWEAYGAKLAELFDVEHISITHEAPQWRTSNDPYSVFKDSLIAKHIAVSPLEGSICVLIPKDTIPHLISKLIKKEDSPFDSFDEDFQEAFTHFLTAEALMTSNQVPFDKELTFSLDESNEFSYEEALFLDTHIALPDYTFHVRVVIPKPFLQSWKARYQERRIDTLLNTSLANTMTLTVHLEAGKTELSFEEWKNLKSGDFVVLDSCSLSPDDSKGRVTLTVNEHPFLRGKIKDSQLKILEYPVLEMGDPPMEKEPEHEDEFAEEPFELEEELLEEEEPAEEELYTGEEEPAVEEEAPEVQVVEQYEKISPENLPITLVIEAGRIEMPLQKLLELQPGNLLELGLSPQSGVDLVVKGKCVGKGELLAIGETLGVRILDI